MVKFNVEKLVVKYQMMSSITPALGGSMRLAHYDENDQEVITRVAIPFAVARSWKEEYKQTKYMVPIPVAVVYYDEMVVMIEKGPQLPKYMLEDPEKYGALFDDEKPFTAHVESNLKIIQRNVNERWHTDGTMMYELPQDLEHAFKTSQQLTADGVFKSCEVPTVKFSELNLAANVENPSGHTVVLIKNAAGKIFTTPPIFKNIAEMRNSKLKSDEGKNDDNRFDLIEKMFDVNMEFALSAGKTVGGIFGNKAVSPLGLPQLMIALTTVNLPNIRTSVRSTFPMGMSFLQAYAWLTGLMDQTDDLPSLIKMRALMKMLCQKGIFKKNTMDRVFRKDSKGQHKIATPTLKSVEELQAHVDTQSEAERLITVDKVLRSSTKKSTKTDGATGMQIED